jgi:nitronate monooxygenase
VDKSRREFAKGSVFASIAMALGNAHAASAAKEITSSADEPAYKPSAHAQAFTEKMGIRYPIAQAVMGGALPELAIAVAQAGGLGGMGMSWSPEAEVRDYVTRVRAATPAPFAVGYVLAFGASTLQVALEAGAPVIQFSFGTPSAAQVAQIRHAGAKFGMQISNLAGAKQAFDVGADYISCQGTESGGHIQAQSSWHEHIDGILAAAGQTPVLVAGGLSGGKDLRKALAMGASGGVFGTRFAASNEYPAHAEYKGLMVKAKAEDTVLTVCFDGGWTNVLHRVLRNSTLDNWEAAGSKPAGQRPGEGDIVGKVGDMPFERYHIWFPSVDTTGQVTDMAMYAGKAVAGILDIAGAGELVHRIWAECEHG